MISHIQQWSILEMRYEYEVKTMIFVYKINVVHVHNECRNLCRLLQMFISQWNEVIVHSLTIGHPSEVFPVLPLLVIGFVWTYNIPLLNRSPLCTKISDVCCVFTDTIQWASKT